MSESCHLHVPEINNLETRADDIHCLHQWLPISKNIKVKAEKCFKRQFYFLIQLVEFKAKERLPNPKMKLQYLIWPNDSSWSLNILSVKWARWAKWWSPVYAAFSLFASGGFSLCSDAWECFSDQGSPNLSLTYYRYLWLCPNTWQPLQRAGFQQMFGGQVSADGHSEVVSGFAEKRAGQEVSAQGSTATGTQRPSVITVE